MKPRRAYATSHYQRTRRRLLGQPCWACGLPATTADHHPPLALHAHRDGTACCTLLPACARCNYSGGAKVGALLRRARSHLRRELLTETRATRTW